MVNGSRVAWAGLILLSGALSGCSNASSIPDFGAPRTDRIIVFYPVGGIVRGRGLADSVSVRAPFVYIRAHPNGSESIRPVEPDGGFEFSILARGGDVLEFSGATDNRGVDRGEPSFIKVPTGTFSSADYICCIDEGSASGRCQTVAEREAQIREGVETIRCPGSESPRIECTFDEECGFEEGEWLEINPSRIQVTAPNANGFIEVSGFVEPRSLVTLQNRGLSGIGQDANPIVLGRVSSDTGDFMFPQVRARGDDELVLQVEDLNGLRSPPYAQKVQDADLAGIDVTGVFPWRPLRDGTVGTVAIQMAPYGIDGRGVCPDNNQRPQTCFSGGLTHEMIEILNLRVDGQGEGAGVTVRPTPISEDLPENRGADGDVRAGPVDVILVVDRSVAATRARLANNPDTVRALTSFIQGLRERDNIAVITYGEQIRRLGVLPDVVGRRSADGLFPGGAGASTLINSIEVAFSQNGAGGSNLFDGVAEAALIVEASSNPARVVVVAAEEHIGSVTDSQDAFDEALSALEGATDASRPLTRVDVVGLALTRTEKFQDIQSITAFTEGAYYDVAGVRVGDVDQLELTLEDIRSTFSGSFLLLYDIAIPRGVGKAARLTFNVRMIGVPQPVSFSGLLRVDLAAN